MQLIYPVIGIILSQLIHCPPPPSLFVIDRILSIDTQGCILGIVITYTNRSLCKMKTIQQYKYRIREQKWIVLFQADELRLLIFDCAGVVI